MSLGLNELNDSPEKRCHSEDRNVFPVFQVGGIVPSRSLYLYSIVVGHLKDTYRHIYSYTSWQVHLLLENLLLHMLYTGFALSRNLNDYSYLTCTITIFTITTSEIFIIGNRVVYAKAMKKWYALYVLQCSWQSLTQNGDIVIHIFNDWRIGHPYISTGIIRIHIVMAYFVLACFGHQTCQCCGIYYFDAARRPVKTWRSTNWIWILLVNAGNIQGLCFYRRTIFPSLRVISMILLKGEHDIDSKSHHIRCPY